MSRAPLRRPTRARRLVPPSARESTVPVRHQGLLLVQYDRRQCGLTTPVLGVEKVHDPVAQELEWVATETKLVQLSQHALALVVLSEILGLECDARMDLVHLDCELILDALDRQVLAHRLELVQRVRIVVILLPLLLQQ